MRVCVLSLSHVKQPAGLEPDDKCLRYSQTKWKAEQLEAWARLLMLAQAR